MSKRALPAALLVALGVCLVLGGTRGLAEPLKAVSDEQFVQMASAADLAEINLATEASKRASNQDVKHYAQKLLQDHEKSSKHLLKLANAKGFTPAATMDPQHKAVAVKLLQHQGADSDKHFVHHMVMDHKKAIALYQSEAKNGRDEGLTSFASKTLPVLREHLKMAEDLDKKVGGAQR
jgi:putative membrane protein